MTALPFNGVKPLLLFEVKIVLLAPGDVVR
jgi:hypothetical protein